MKANQFVGNVEELCEWTDKYCCTFLTKDECQTIINDLCTN